MLAALLLTAVLAGPEAGAWRGAQVQIAHRYPQYRRQIYAMPRPNVGFRRGIFHDPIVGKDVYGSCVLGRNPEILIGIVRDRAVNRDSIIHEYKHAITFRLPLSDRDLTRATNWIDRETGGFGQPATKPPIASRARLTVRKTRGHLSARR